MASSVERALIEIGRTIPSDRIRTDVDVREAFCRDESETVPSMPDAVVHVASTAEVSAVLVACSASGVPVTPRAAGTGRTGGAVPLRGGIVLAMERFDSRVDVDAREGLVDVHPGAITAAVHAAVEREGWFYPPDPSSLASSTIGGNIASNAGGPRAVRYGVTGDYVLGLEIVTGAGDVLSLGRRTRKGVTGYDLSSLIVGSEGTLGIVTRATLRLIAKPESVGTLLVHARSEADVARLLQSCLRSRFPICALELLDETTLSVMREGGVAVGAAPAMLLIEIDGTVDRVDADLERLGAELDDAGASEILVARTSAERERLWSVRREMSRALRKRARFKMSEDVVVPRTKIGELLIAVRAIGEKHRILMPAYGHAGDGNLHVNLLWDDPEQNVDAAIEELFRATIALGGTLSGEHGIGALKAPYLPLEQSPQLIDMQRRIKSQFDPRSILNPGKIFPAPRVGHG